MKLTSEQRANVNVLVSNEVQYRETYQEIYDHVVSSMEERDSMPDLQKAYVEILEEDFGGHRGLEKLEAMRERELRKNITRKKWNNFGTLFKWPNILMITPLLIINYYSIHNNGFKLLSLIVVLIAMFLPMLVITIRNFLIGLKIGKGNSKKSIKDKALNSIGGFIWIVWWIVGIVSTILGYLASLFNYKVILFPAPLTPVIFSAIFWFCVLNTVAVFKVYKDEFKTQLS